MLPRSAPPSDVAQSMAEAAAAATHEDWDAALAIWVEHAHAGVPRAQAEIGRC